MKRAKGYYSGACITQAHLVGVVIEVKDLGIASPGSSGTLNVAFPRL